MVKLGERVEALVLTKEDKDGATDPVEEAGRSTSVRGGKIESVKEADGIVKGMVIEVVKGRPHRRHRVAWLLARVARRTAPSA